MSVKITYFVHGTTTDNEQDRSTGWLPGELSPLGIAQAKELGELVKNVRFDAMYCSDLKRAVDSAQLGFGDTYAIIPDSRLRECNYGDLNGAPTESFKEGRMQEYIDTPFPGGESYKDVEKRMADLLSEVREKHQSQHIAFLAHEGPQLALDVLISGKTWEEAITQNWRTRPIKEWKPGWEYEA